MYKVYLFTDFESIDESFLQKCMKVLPPERKSRVHRYKFLIDRKMCIISYLLLLYALRKNYHIKDPRFGYSKNGKPYLMEYPDIHFNLSHCSKGCICAVSNRSIGVDIQDIRPFSWEIAKIVCCDNELKLLEISDDKNKMFTQMWAMKESNVKMIGHGIDKIKSFDTTKYKDRFDIFYLEKAIISLI